MSGVMLSLSLIIGIAAILTALAKAMKQPPIIAYLIAGILVGPLFLGLMGPESSSLEPIQIFAQIGVAFLLFVVGLSLDFRVLKELGSVSSIVALIQISLTFGFGFLIATYLGLGTIAAAYIAIGLAFSSTVVVIKILSDKKEMETLHARIALGILIVQDFVAALALLLSPLLADLSLTPILASIGKIALLTLVIFLFSGIILRKYLHHLAKNQEALFLFGIAWALIIATLFHELGFSLEIGALIAGMALASSSYTLELGSKIKPLRDFFIVLFFVFFGSQLAGPITSTLVKQALLLSTFVFLGKPLIIMTTMKLLGHKKRTNLLTGLSLAQISEFSLILILLGFKLGHVSQNLMNLAILVALMTIGASSYAMYHANFIYSHLSRIMPLFEGNGKEHPKNTHKQEYDVILFGHDRMGWTISESLKKTKMRFLIVDYNPATIMDLNRKGIPATYGDAQDPEFLAELKLENTKLIISTIPEVMPNLAIKKEIKESKSKTTFIATAERFHEAETLYELGTDYVILPHLLSGKYTAELIEKNRTSKAKYRKIAKQQRKEFRKRFNN